MSASYRLATSEPWACVGGRFVPLSEAAVPIWDLGFLQGVTISERLRTARGAVWLLPEHLRRLRVGLACCGLNLVTTDAEIESIIAELLRRNRQCLPAGEYEREFSISLAVTGGDSSAYGPRAYQRSSSHSQASPQTCRLVIHAVPLDVATFVPAYRDGVQLFASPVREIPHICLPKSFKSRNRLHYWLAEQDPRYKPLRVLPLLCNLAGEVCETPTCSLLIREGEQFFAPPPEDVLSGVTLEFIERQLNGSGRTIERQPISLERIKSASEVLLTTTSAILFPVVGIDDWAIGGGTPGPTFRSLFERVVLPLTLGLT